MTNPSECKIYEFSTGIFPDFDSDGRWFSRRFTGNYMNVSVPGGTIPQEVQRAIANELFSVVEGEEDNPAIVGRVVPGSTDYSVVALATLGRDEINRPIAVYRYFLCEGQYNLWKILAWFRHYYQQYGKLPTFNPGDIRQQGDYFTPPTDSQHPNMTLDDAGERLIEPQDTPILIQGQQLDFHQVHILAMNKAYRVNQPVSWAYNVEGLEKPNRFVIIHAASNDAYKQIKAQISPSQQQLQLVNVGVHDEKALESAMKNITTSGRVKEQYAQVIAQVINNHQVTEQHWQQLFKAQGADSAGKVSSAPMARLLTLRAMVIPERLPDLVQWFDLARNQPNKEACLQFQFQFYHYFPEQFLDELNEKLAKGLTFVIEKMLARESRPETIVEILLQDLRSDPTGRVRSQRTTNSSVSSVPGEEKTAWLHCLPQLAQDIGDDFSFLGNLDFQQKSAIKQQINSNQQIPQLKCNPVLWTRLLDGFSFKATRKQYKKNIKNYDLDYYFPLAQFFEKLKAPRLAAYFYQISQGEVPDEIFMPVFREVLRNNNSHLYYAGEWKIRGAICKKKSLLQLSFITLHHKRTWKDWLILAIYRLRQLLEQLWELLQQLLRGLNKSVQWIITSSWRILWGLGQSIFSVYKLIPIFRKKRRQNAQTYPYRDNNSKDCLKRLVVGIVLIGLLILGYKLITKQPISLSWLKKENRSESILTTALEQDNLEETKKQIEKTKTDLEARIEAAGKETQPKKIKAAMNQAICLDQKPFLWWQPCDLDLFLIDSKGEDGKNKNQEKLKPQIEKIYLYQQKNGLKPNGIIGPNTQNILLRDALKNYDGQISPFLPYDEQQALAKFTTTTEQLNKMVEEIIKEHSQYQKINGNIKNAIKGVFGIAQNVQYGQIIGGTIDEQQKKDLLKKLSDFQEKISDFSGQLGIITAQSELTISKLKEAVTIKAFDESEEGIKNVVDKVYEKVQQDEALHKRLLQELDIENQKSDEKTCSLKKHIGKELETLLKIEENASVDYCADVVSISENLDTWVKAIYNYQKGNNNLKATADGILSSNGKTANKLVEAVSAKVKENKKEE